MAPSVAFALPGEPGVVLQPLNIVVRVQPCSIGVGKDVLRCGTADAGDPDFVRVLRTVHLLDEQLVASGDKLHTGNIVVPRITGNLDPGCCSPGYWKIAHFDRRVRAAGFRIREMQDGRVDGIHIIDDVEHTRSFRVALPVGDILSVRAPSETVAAGEFFFIHPVECTVHDRLAPVIGQLRDLAGSDIFYIYIIVRNESHTCSVRREFGKHHRRLGKSLPQLAQSPVFQSQYPVVALRVVTPYPFRIIIDQNLSVVSAPGDTANGNRLPGLFVDKHRRRNDDFPPVVFGAVGNNVHTACLGVWFHPAVSFAILHPCHGADSFCLHQSSSNDIFQMESTLCCGRFALCKRIAVRLRPVFPWHDLCHTYISGQQDARYRKNEFV